MSAASSRQSWVVTGTAPWSAIWARIRSKPGRSSARTSNRALLESWRDWPIAIRLMRNVPPLFRIQSRIFGRMRLSMICPWTSTSSQATAAPLGVGSTMGFMGFPSKLERRHARAGPQQKP